MSLRPCLARLLVVLYCSLVLGRDDARANRSLAQKPTMQTRIVRSLLEWYTYCIPMMTQLMMMIHSLIRFPPTRRKNEQFSMFDHIITSITRCAAIVNLQILRYTRRE
jgi:hypothetical protein